MELSKRIGSVTPRVLVGLVGAVVGLGALTWASAQDESGRVLQDAQTGSGSEQSDETISQVDIGAMAAMASVGFSYVDENGREWAGPGRLRLEAFGRDGVVTGSFTGVSLPHTEKTLPNVTLADGTFRARISRP